MLLHFVSDIVKEIKSISGRILLMKTYKRIVATMFVLALILPTITVSAQTAEPRSAAITFTTPTPNPVVVGNEIVFDLVISTANIDPGVSGADIYLQYYSTFVDVPPSPNSVAEAKPDFFGVSNVSVNEITQCPSTASPTPTPSPTSNPVVKCVHLVVAGPPQITHSGAIASFHFRAIAAGTTCFSVAQSTLADANGFPTGANISGQQCVTVINPPKKITGTVLRQGTPALPSGGGTLSCFIVGVAVADKAGGAGPTSDVNGQFTLDNLPNGTYTLFAFYPGYLASGKTITITDSSPLVISAGTTTLRGGDVNGDNVINILDIGSIIGKFGQKASGVGSSTPANCNVTDDPADINDDGLVNISDLAIAAGNWQNSGPKPW
jgi:hypothetical protein